MKRQLKVIAIVVSIIVFIYGIPVYAAETEWIDTITVSTETELKNAINNATNSTCILLSSDIVLTEGTIEIPEEKKIKIASDTAGVNRKLDGDSRFRVIYNKGELYLESITVTNGNVSGQHDFGGGIFSAYNSILIVADCLITNNYAEGYGGGIYAVNGNVTVTNCTISYNTVGISGGGIYSSASLEITDCTISGNLAKGSDGGGLYIDSGSTIILDSVINNNIAESSGGGIASFGTQLMLADCIIDANIALRDMGGGIFAVWDISLTNCVVSNNTAGENGGGIFIALDMEILRSDGTTFYGNIAKEGYYIAYTDCEQHDRLITNTVSLSEPFSVDAWIRHYAYNNYDIGYKSGLSLSGIRRFITWSMAIAILLILIITVKKIKKYYLRKKNLNMKENKWLDSLNPKINTE